jgi:hypothetical protein
VQNCSLKIQSDGARNNKILMKLNGNGKGQKTSFKYSHKLNQVRIFNLTKFLFYFFEKCAYIALIRVFSIYFFNISFYRESLSVSLSFEHSLACLLFTNWNFIVVISFSSYFIFTIHIYFSCRPK